MTEAMLRGYASRNSTENHTPQRETGPICAEERPFDDLVYEKRLWDIEHCTFTKISIEHVGNLSNRILVF